MKMKMVDKDYLRLRGMVMPAMAQIPSLEEYKDAGMTEQRHRWDALWQANRSCTKGLIGWFQNAYKYLNDDHIDTALRKIQREYLEGRGNQ